MKTAGLVLLIVIFGSWVAGLCWLGTYNAIDQEIRQVEQSWAKVDKIYAMRLDFARELANLLTDYEEADHLELKFIDEVQQTSAKLNILPLDLVNDMSKRDQFLTLQQQFTQELDQLLALIKNYPRLAADEHYQVLMWRLKQNRDWLEEERRNNEVAVRTYNKSLQGPIAARVARYYKFLPQKPFTI